MSVSDFVGPSKTGTSLDDDEGSSPMHDEDGGDDTPASGEGSSI